MPDPERIRFARSNRRQPTKAESRLWYELRNRQLGVRFRRQDPIGPYIADFSCRDRRLVIEIDGITHEDLEEADARRDAWFETRGWRVLRFGDDDVLDDIEGALEVIVRALADA